MQLHSSWLIAVAMFAWTLTHAHHSAAAQPSADAAATTRIVSLVPALTEVMYAVGAEAQLAGVSQFCLYPPEAQKRPTVGGLLNPNLENVLRLRPHVVLLYRSQSDFAGRLHSLGVRSHLQDLDRLEHLYEAIGRVGEITGKGAEATSLSASLRNSFQAVSQRNASQRPVRALVVVSRSQTALQHLYQAGPQNFLGELLVIAGGTHAVVGGAAISREDIIRAGPEVIIDMSLAEGGKRAGLEESAQALWSELSTVPAVRNGRVHTLVNPHSLVPGPFLPEVAKQFEKILQPR